MDLKGNISGRTIYLPSFIVIAFILAKLWRGGESPPPPHPGSKGQKEAKLIIIHERIGVKCFQQLSGNTVFPQIIAGGDYFFFRTEKGRLFDGGDYFKYFSLQRVVP